MDASDSTYDVVVVGGGHNGLTAAAYLGRAGLSVLVLERLDHTGGAAVSAQVFAGQPARLSTYASLVSLLPDRIAADLDLGVELRPRAFSSYTPYERDGRSGGLLVENSPAEATRASMRALTGSDESYAAWQEFHARIGSLVGAVAPTLLQPLPREREIASQVDASVWTDFVTTPIGAVIERSFADDTLRGVVASDAVLGSFVSPRDPSLLGNRVFLQHLMGRGTGGWRVPVGGMGAVADALERAARAAGAQILTSAGVSAIRAGADGAEVDWHDGQRFHTVSAGHVLANTAPWVLDILVGHEQQEATRPVGSQLTINALLDRLPRLRSGVDPALAFAGTLHVGQDYTALTDAYAAAADGHLPDLIPGQVVCHTLTDPSILGEEPGGRHTLSYVGLHTPRSLFEGSDREAVKAVAVARALAGIDVFLAEPLAGCLARDAHGRLCLEARIPQEIEAELAMPGGHLHHGEPAWPWAANRARLDTPAQQWGVNTYLDRVLICGAGARRGGGVSGLAGHHAAQAVLDAR